MVKVGDAVNYFDERHVRGPLYLSGEGPYAAIVTYVAGDGDDVSANLAVFINMQLVFQNEVHLNSPRGMDTRYFTTRD